MKSLPSIALAVFMILIFGVGLYIGLENQDKFEKNQFISWGSPMMDEATADAVAKTEEGFWIFLPTFLVVGAICLLGVPWFIGRWQERQRNASPDSHDLSTSYMRQQRVGRWRH